MDQESTDLQGSIAEIRKGLALVGRDIGRLGAKKERNNRARLSLLHVHALTATCVGAGVIANGPDGISSPAYAGVRLVPGAPLTVGSVLLALGLLLTYAIYQRWVRVEIFAMAGMAIWYLLFASSFAYAMFAWYASPIGMKPSWQGMFTYWGWSAMIFVHLRVLLWIDRHRAKGRQ